MHMCPADDSTFSCRCAQLITQFHYADVSGLSFNGIMQMCPAVHSTLSCRCAQLCIQLCHADVPCCTINFGCRTGVSNSDYRALFRATSSNVDNYTVTGISNSIIAARVSYVFDLRGPSLVLDTACSSSLIGVHLACQAIRTGRRMNGFVTR